MLANNDAPGSDGILAQAGGMHTWWPSLFGCLQLPSLVPRSASSSSTLPVSPAQLSHRSVQFSSPEPERLAASFLEYLSPKQTRHKLGNACPWRLHQVPCNACFG